MTQDDLGWLETKQNDSKWQKSTWFQILYTQNLVFSDAHTSSLMISDSDSDGGDEEIIFDDDLNRQTKIHISSSDRRSGNGNMNFLLV